MTLKALQGGVRLYRSLQERAGTRNIKRLLLIKENQMSQVKEFSIFLCMGRCKSLGSLKSFLLYASQRSGASIRIVHTAPPPHPPLQLLNAHCGEWLMAAR